MTRGAAVGAFVAMLALVATACGSTRIVTKTVTVPASPKGGLGPPGDITSLTYEYGTAFTLTAGLMNLLLVLDSFDIAEGRKE